MIENLDRRVYHGPDLPTHVTLAVVLQVRQAAIRSACSSGSARRPPFEGAWSLPGGYLEPGHALERSIRTQLARKVDVAELSWLEQLETVGDPGRHPGEWQLATAYLGLVPRGLDPALPPDTPGIPSTSFPSELAFDHGPIVLAGRERLRAKLSYTNIGFALAPATFTMSELSAIYTAALGYAGRPHEPPPGAGAPRPARRDRRAPLPRPGRRPSGGGLQVRHPRARRDRPVRGAPAAYCGSSRRLTSSAGAECVSAPTLM